MPTIAVNDIQMYYEIHGKGKPLVLIGGLGIDLSEMESVSHWLAQKYQVLVFDNRGAGRTEKPDMPYSIEMMAQDTAALLSALAIERASILGISMGGRLEGIDPEEETQQAIDDWHYWVKQGYEF